jgi:tetratricopeptide (TPR) repeat protein/transcriptional regulator with XRE-family HTH domain
LYLKKARERHGWSQDHLAREIGTDSFTVSRWERGVSLPSPHFRQRLCELFGLSIVELGLVPSEAERTVDQGPPQPEKEALQPAFVQAPVLDPVIPPPRTQGHGLVGRDSLLHYLKQRLLNKKTAAFSALSGLPGVGKTALATTLAHDEDMRTHFIDGVLWAGLGYEPDVLGLLSRWGMLLHCTPPDLAQRSSPQAWAAAIRAAIGQRRMLLVIDGAWKIEQALAFQVGGPNCAHVVTTRFPQVARRFAVDGVVVVRELGNTDGRLLLMRLAPEVVQAEPEEAQALVTAVGGLPLALTLLGNFLRAQAHSGQPRRLRAALERLRRADERLLLNEPQPLIGGYPSLSAGTPLSLQVVIGMSDQQVSEDARRTLRALSVFPPKPNTFSEEAAEVVSGLPVETLDELTDAGLVESSGPARYMLHQTIADYACTHLIDAMVVERQVDYFISYVEGHSGDYAALDRERNNILAALEAAFEHGLLPSLVRGVHAFAPLLIIHGLYTVAEVQLQRSLNAARASGDVAGQVTAWLHLGKIAEQLGNYTQAQANWEKGLALAQGNDNGDMAQILQEIGGLAWHQGQPERARRFFEEALNLRRELEDQRGIADTLKSLANLAAEQGQPELAHRLYQEALEVFRLLDDRRGFAITQNNLGILAREQGQPEQARLLYEEALSILREIGDQSSTAAVLTNLGNLARNMGQPELARLFLEESLTILRQLANRRSLAFALFNLGNLATDQGQFEQADQYLNEALITFRELQARRDAALTLQTLGLLMRKQEQNELARQHLEEALAIFHDLQDRRQQALTQRELATLARQQGQLEQAQQLYNGALAMLLPLEDWREVAVTRLESGILARQQGRLEEAHRLLTEALVATRQIKDRQNVALALKELGLIMLLQGQCEQALCILLNAGVGLQVMNSPDVLSVEERLKQLFSQMEKDTFLAMVRHMAAETPEPAYGIDQDAWNAAVWQLAKQTSGVTSTSVAVIEMVKEHHGKKEEQL